MKLTKVTPFLSSCFLLFLTLPLLGQVEICDNALDDDGDGFIDLSDEDCSCRTVQALSLIPNPSFEDQECCPNNRSQMNCATTWIQASAPTTDYIHQCGWLGWENLPMPLPIPDGEGAVGFRDGRFDTQSGGDNPNFKEYLGACLIRPLRAGTRYKFRFHVGFTNPINSPPINVSFFGTNDCDNLPFGNGDETFGCPTNGPNWQRLGNVYTSGSNEWKEYEINVAPRTDIYAITIGPDCPQRDLTENPYYFFDNLILAEESAFEFDIRANTQPCADDINLFLPDYDSLTYQWYKNGVALIGETNATLQNPPGDGQYTAIFGDGTGCTATKTFDFRVPTFTTATSATICQGETYAFNYQALSKAGVYYDSLKNSNNCDSIIRLTLNVDSNLTEVVNAKIFPNEAFLIGDVSFRQPGQFQRTITSSFGCDSTVLLTLDFYNVYIPNVFSPNGDGINDYFTIAGDEELVQINKLTIADRWGNQVYAGWKLVGDGYTRGWDGQMGAQPVPNGVYLYMAEVLMDDQITRTFSGTVTLMR
ncbi:MAG: gliding motility-associated C-terminal domain-containing protein [Bacteroidota bacterium]